MADTRVRLWHVGPYRHGWEEAGGGVIRHDDFTFQIVDGGPGEPLPPLPAATPQPTEGFTQDWFTYNTPLWSRLLAPLVGRPIRALEVGVFEGRSAVWLLDHVLTPLNRQASRRFLREARQKVWHNTLQLQAARTIGPDAYAERLSELEVLSAAKIVDLQAPGQVLLRLAVAGFGVTLPPPA